MLFSELEAFFPPVLLHEDFKSGHVTTSNNLVDLVVGHVHFLLFLVDLINPHLLHLSWANLTSTLKSSLVFFAVEVSFNGLVKEPNILVEISSRLVLLDIQEARSKDSNDFLNFALLVGHSEVESIGPDVFELFFVLEVAFSDFQISVDGLSIVTRLFPHLGRVDNFRS